MPSPNPGCQMCELEAVIQQRTKFWREHLDDPQYAQVRDQIVARLMDLEQERQLLRGERVR